MGAEGPVALAALSSRLTDALAAVELQRATLEEVLLRLAEQAQHLAAVSGVLTGATHAQGAVLQELQQLLQGNGATVAKAEAALQPAVAAVAQAAQMLAPPATPSAEQPMFSASFDDAPLAAPSPKPSAAPPPVAPPAPPPAAPPVAAPAPPSSCSSFGSGTSIFARPTRAVQVIEPDMDDDDGVQFVSNLTLKGNPIVGTTVTAEAEFVGQPTIQWYRIKGAAPAEAIEGATSLAYALSADDVGCVVRIDCVGPFGGDPVSAALAEVKPDQVAIAELQKLLGKKGGEKEIHVRSVPGDEARVLLLTREKLKVRKKKHTELKHDYRSGLGVHLNAYDDKSFTLQLDASGATTIELAAENGAARDMVVYMLRSLAPGGGFSAAAPGAPAGAPSRQADDAASEATRSNEDDEFMDHLKKGGGRSRGEDDDEDFIEEEELDEFKPAVEFKIRSADDPQSALPSADKLRSISSSFAAPPPPGGGSRRRGVSMSAAGPSAVEPVPSRVRPGGRFASMAATSAPPSAAPTGEAPGGAQDNGPLADVRKARQLHEAAEAAAIAEQARAQEIPSTPAAPPAQPKPAAQAAPPPQPEPAAKVAEAPAGRLVKRGQSLDQMLPGSEDGSQGEKSPPTVPGPPSAPSPATSGGAQALVNLLSIESISATFDGAVLRAGSFQAMGELRVLQLARHDVSHGFQIALENVKNIKGVQANPKFARAVEGSNGLAFEVRLPARQTADASKPLALMQYGSKPEYAPVPLKVTPRWSHANGADRLELRVAAHPALKGGLTDVRISVTMGEEVTACRCEPAGDWKQETRTLTWKVAHVVSSEAPKAFKADFATGGASREGRKGKPLAVHFASNTCNLTGLQPRSAANGAVGKVLQRFVSSKYIVNV